MVAIVVLVAGLAGAALLLAAELTPLLHIHSTAGGGLVKTIGTGSHDSYAMVPVALVAALLSVEAWRGGGSRVVLAAVALLGAVALGIALLHDLPDAQATGLIGNLRTGLRIAVARPAAGLYLETLGAALLLLAGVTGLLLGRPPRARPADTASGPGATAGPGPDAGSRPGARSGSGPGSA